MLVTPNNVNFFFTDLKNQFWQAYGVAPTFFDKICTIRPVTTEQVLDGWIGMLDKVRRWDGARTVHSPAPQTYLVTIDPFELTESIDLFKLEDDNFGLYYPTVQFMGFQTRKWPDFQVRDLLKNLGVQIGARQNGLDGLSFWNAAHPIDFYDSTKGTFVNDFTGGGVSINSILTGGAMAPNAYATLWQEFVSRKSETNEALGVIPSHTVYAPQVDITVKTILNAQFFAPATLGNVGAGSNLVGATENMLKGSTNPLMVPEFAADPNVWYMFDLTRSIKPIVWNLRMAPDFVYRNQPQDPVVFDTHTYVYGSKMRGTPSWSHAWLAARSGP